MKLESKTIRFRFVEEADADFILNLRLDDRYNQFLSGVSPDLEAQKEWIKNYKYHEADGTQFYFIIERLDSTKCGTVRIYDLKENSFCWGSWILNEEKTRYAALESAFLVYQFGFDELGYEQSHFDVMKGNKGVISFHEKMGAVRIGEDEDNVYFTIAKDTVIKIRERFKEKLL